MADVFLAQVALNAELPESISKRYERPEDGLELVEDVATVYDGSPEYLKRAQSSLLLAVEDQATPGRRKREAGRRRS